MKVLILAGGSGTRLYPLSTPQRPKQFLALANEKPLIINTIERFLPLVAEEDIIIITGENYRQKTQALLEKYAYKDVHIVCEPCAKNTGPAIVLGVKYCIQVLNIEDGETILIVPSDHAINPESEYLKIISKLPEQTNNFLLVLMGVKASSPNVEFGYIQADAISSSLYSVKNFKEKPDLELARKYIEQGNYFWNAGMFSFKAGKFPELIKNSQNLESLFKLSMENIVLGFKDAVAESFDREIVEKTGNIGLLPLNCYWSDLGTWESIYEASFKDENGNACLGNVSIENCKDSLFIADIDCELRASQQQETISVVSSRASFLSKRQTNKL